MVSGVRIGNDQAAFIYPGTRRNDVLFDASGKPIWIDAGAGTTYLMLDGMVLLDYGSLQQIVRVAPITGRVSFE